MKILAIDPATKCGFAHSSGHHGTWDLSVRRDESGGMRLVRFEAKLLEIIRGLGVDVIAYETPNVAQGKKANTDGLKLVCRLEAIIQRLCELEGSPQYIGYNLSTIKKHAGARNKEEILQRARAKWLNLTIEDDNEADALWLLDLAKQELMSDD